jgi:hypothetical protein
MLIKYVFLEIKLRSCSYISTSQNANKSQYYLHCSHFKPHQHHTSNVWNIQLNNIIAHFRWVFVCIQHMLKKEQMIPWLILAYRLCGNASLAYWLCGSASLAYWLCGSASLAYWLLHQCQSPTHLSTNKYGCPSKVVFTFVVLWNLIAYTREVHSRASEFFLAHCIQHNQSFSFMICLCILSGVSLWRVTVTVSLQES